MKRHHDKLAVRQQLLDLLTTAAKDRHKREAWIPRVGEPGWTEPGWVAYERDLMFAAVNRQRSARGLEPVFLKEIMRVEQFAVGHSDYMSKFTLYCAELAVGERVDP